ncbi:IclR family transcriptional regulator [Cupriavidus sp. H39]|uniref:IclR family transcriptional regulator n=1 Tax=Cupriavidus sp. H39 TaxID=3401635 RepID=UPI003D01DDCB
MSNHSNAAAVRAFRILEILSAADGPLSLAAIVEAIELPKQTVHRILKQLESTWLVSRTAGNRHYECSSRVRQLAVNVLMQAGPAAARHAILQQLVDKVGETCNLTMLSGDDVVYLDRVETQWPLRMHLQPGSRVPLHCTASGKLLLAFLPSAQRQRLVASLPLRAHSAHTITSAEALDAELAETRRRRLGVNNQENLEGMIALAVPVMRNRSRACAAIAVQVPMARMTMAQLMAFVPDLRLAAAEMVKTFCE